MFTEKERNVVGLFDTHADRVVAALNRIEWLLLALLAVGFGIFATVAMMAVDVAKLVP